MQTEMQGERRRMSHEKKNGGGGRPKAPPTVPFFLASSSARGPIDMSVCMSYGDPWKIIITFLMLMLMQLLTSIAIALFLNT